MVSGVLEKGWWLGGLVVGGSGGSGYIGGGQGNWETGTWTNVDNILMVEKRAAGVVWCGDGEYQFEIHERTTGRAAGCTRRASGASGSAGSAPENGAVGTDGASHALGVGGRV